MPWDGWPDRPQAPLRCELAFRAQFSAFCNRIPWKAEKHLHIPLVWFWHLSLLHDPFLGSSILRKWCGMFFSSLKPKTISFWRSCDVGIVKLLKELPKEMPNQRTSYRLWSKLKATGPTQIAVLLSQADNYQNVFWFFFVYLFVFVFLVPWETGHICSSAFD